jgi:ubiquinol-cytochrome c reductase iron-sulfur subunit
MSRGTRPPGPLLREQVEPPEVDLDDPRLTRFDLVKEGARRDGIDVVYYQPRFPVPGTKAEKRIERSLALMFLLAGAAATAFLVIYIWWPWKYDAGSNASKLYTPLLGLTLALALALIGYGLIAFTKQLMPVETAIEHRHEGEGSPPDDRKTTGALLASVADDTQIQRRPLLKGALTLGLLPIGAVAAAPLVGGLIKSPHNEPGQPEGLGDVLMHTGFNPGYNNGQPVRLVHEDGTPIRPSDVSIGGQITVFPGIPDGATNKFADSPTLLIHLRTTDAETLRRNLAHVPQNAGVMWGDYVAYSKICTHAGCPASLYEQQTNRLLCPCHQSQFQITDNARPIFGPATRRLPALPLEVDSEGFFIAKSDYKVAVGPGFWERP